MAGTSANQTLAQNVGTLIGGPDNVSWVGSCTTRLRFVVKDESRVDFDGLNGTPGVIQAVRSGGQVQVVIGTHVEEIAKELLEGPEWRSLGSDDGGASAAASRGERRKPLDVVFDFLGATFQPLMGPITGAALVQVLALLLTQFGVIAPDSGTAGVLTATGNAIFYFLPIFVAFTATRKLGANPFIGATIAAALLHPGITAIGESGSVAEAFGLPLFVYSYASTMFPSLLLALALAGLDRVLKRIMPKMLQQVFNPAIELVVLVPVTVLVFGPIGVMASTGVGTATQWLATNAPMLFYVLIPAVWIFVVAMGIHWALLTIAIADLATTGSSVIFAAAFGYQYAIVGVAIGVFIRAARLGAGARSVRDTAAASAVAAAIGGVTEPTVYGLVLRYRRILAILIVSSAAAGAVLGLFHVAVTGISGAPLLALPLMQPLIGALLSLAVGVTVSIVLLQVWGYEKKAPAEAGATDADTLVAPGYRGATDASASDAEHVIAAPVAGQVQPLSATGDPVFAGELIGPGIAIEPAQGRVVSPADGVVVAAPASAHALGIRTDDGVELLIHVGIDTVKLAGRHFVLRVAQGERVTAGQPLVEFDMDAIRAEGYSLITPVVVTNAAAGQRVDVLAEGVVGEGTALLAVRPAQD